MQFIPLFHVLQSGKWNVCKMGLCNGQAMNAGQPLGNGVDHYYTWDEQIQELNNGHPLIVGQLCRLCVIMVNQNLICLPGNIIDTCVMDRGVVSVSVIHCTRVSTCL